ncbi:PBP GOBP domain containing protein, partial [Asbolus verrucosus]
GIFAVCSALDKEFIDQVVAKIRSVGEECIAETQATKDDINSLLAHNIPDSHEGKCLLFCFHKHFHIQNDDGTLDRNGAIKALEPLKENDQDVYDTVLKIFSTCADEAATDADPCIYSSNLADCALREGKA